MDKQKDAYFIGKISPVPELDVPDLLERKHTGEWEANWTSKA